MIGVDADAASMRTAAVAAARRKSFAPNALFVVAAVEALPGELDGLADEVRIHFPWASLLRGLVRAEPWFVSALAAIAAPGARILALVSVTDRDVGAATPMPASSLAAAYERAGVAFREIRPATSEEIAETDSSWAKRVGAGRGRPVTVLRGERI